MWHRLLATLLFATPLFVAQPVSLHPVAPTSIDRIALHVPVTCAVHDETVQRVGAVIKVTFEMAFLCDPPITFSHVVELEPLPPGEYRVDVMLQGSDELYASRSFVVRNGGPSPFSVHPFAVRAGSTGLRMWIGTPAGGEICRSVACDGVSVSVHGVPVTNLQVERTSATFDAPNLPPGLYDVVLRTNDGVTTSFASVYYFDRPDPSVFERILFPVLDSVSGAIGSQWVSEASYLNPRPWPVETFKSIVPIVCLVSPCGDQIAPREHTSFRGSGYAHGVALLVPRPEAPDLAFSLRVRDVSRSAEGLGTEVPVVREKNMFRDTTITLLDIPLDPRYRVKVRMYAFEPFFFPGSQAWRVVIAGPNGTRVEFIDVHRDCPACAELPAYFEMDLPSAGKDEFATVFITPPAESFAWAFASVTNNTTQQVTLVTPNGEGGAP